MNDTKLLPDDPKLTAYALGELDPADRAVVEAALRDDPAARAAVEEIRAMAAQLEGALAAEVQSEAAAEKPIVGPASKLARAAIIPGKDFSKLDGGGAVNGHPSPLAKVVRFPQFYYVAACVAAACFAVMVALRTPRQPLAPQPAYTQVDLASLPTALPQAETAAPAEKAPAADTAAATTVVVNLAPVLAPATGANQVASATPAPSLTKSFSLFEQAKDLQAAKTNQPAAATVAFQAVGADAVKKESWNTLAARNEPLVITGNADSANLRKDDANGEGAGKGSVQTAQPVLARRMVAQAAVAPTSAQFTGGAASAPRADVVQLSAFSVAAPAAAIGGIALNSADRGMIVSENRGRFGYVATDLDKVFPASPVRPPASADRYADVRDNDFLGAMQNRLSTFSIDVDTASYSNVRRFLRGHQRPPRDAVRIEELVNYFPYRYAPPAVAKRDGVIASPASPAPFAASLEVADAPWAPTHRLVRIGLKGREVSTATRPAANLVFLLDVSGSMNAPNRLPLVKESMRLLVGKLRPDDRVAIVTYAGNSGLALESTSVSHAKEILETIDNLGAGGSTNGGMGIKLAYDIAKANFVPGGVNRVILCTDGDFNVGVTGEGELTRLIEEKAKSGVALTALGFGMGNLKDATLEKLADHGNGNYGYIDSRREAEKMLVEQVNGTLVTIAKDVKIQVEFNPARVASYRLIGYENRLLKKEDFNNDAVDAGEIGAGHTVTAFYEIVPVGAEDPAVANVAEVDELKYRPVQTASRTEKKADFATSRVADPVSNELLTVKLRYKEPAGDVSQKVEFPLTDSGAKFANASTDFKFAAAVASFGMILRESPHKGSATMADVVAWAESGNTDDVGGYRAEFVELAREADKLER